MSAPSSGAGSGGARGIGVIKLLAPNPTIALFTSWPTLVEIIARIAIMVLLLITFIAASVAQDEVGNFDDYGNAVAAAGWVIFVGVFGFIYEFFFLVCRLLNLSFIGVYRTVVIVVDLVANVVFAILFFTGAVPEAYFADELKERAPFSGSFEAQVRAAGDALGAGAFFTFISMFTFIFLAIWMVLYLVFRLDTKQSSSSSSSSST